MDKGHVNEVVLVGGSTRIPKVQSLLQVSAPSFWLAWYLSGVGSGARHAQGQAVWWRRRSCPACRTSLANPDTLTNAELLDLSLSQDYFNGARCLGVACMNGQPITAGGGQNGGHRPVRVSTPLSPPPTTHSLARSLLKTTCLFNRQGAVQVHQPRRGGGLRCRGAGAAVLRAGPYCSHAPVRAPAGAAGAATHSPEAQILCCLPHEPHPTLCRPPS